MSRRDCLEDSNQICSAENFVPEFNMAFGWRHRCRVRHAWRRWNLNHPSVHIDKRMDAGKRPQDATSVPSGSFGNPIAQHRNRRTEMQSKRLMPLIAASTLTVAMLGMPTVASAKPPCGPGKSSSPVGYYLKHWCYPGLNTYKDASQGRQHQMVFPRQQQKQVKSHRRQVFAPR
jgi:hypothetical protein